MRALRCHFCGAAIEVVQGEAWTLVLHGPYGSPRQRACRDCGPQLEAVYRETLQRMTPPPRQEQGAEKTQRKSRKSEQGWDVNA